MAVFHKDGQYEASDLSVEWSDDGRSWKPGGKGAFNKPDAADLPAFATVPFVRKVRYVCLTVSQTAAFSPTDARGGLPGAAGGRGQAHRRAAVARRRMARAGAARCTLRRRSTKRSWRPR